MNIENEQQNNDVLVMFPASKNFVPPVTRPTPLTELIDEISGIEKSLERKKSTEVPDEIRTLSEVTHAFETRLKMLEDISDRIKFYVDDLDTELLKK